jgi:hypothetical protein
MSKCVGVELKSVVRNGKGRRRSRKGGSAGPDFASAIGRNPQSVVAAAKMPNSLIFNGQARLKILSRKKIWSKKRLIINDLGAII